MNDGTTAKRHDHSRGRLHRPRGRSWRDIRAVIIATLMIAGITTVAQPATPASAAGIIGGFNIDGVVLGTGGEEVDATFFPDPSGNTDELGADNENTTKIGNIHGDTPPTLEYTNPNPGNDLTGVWLDTNVDANGDVWLYFAFSREAATNGQVGFEFQRADAPLLNGSPIDYGQLEVVNPPGAPPGSYTADVIANYNPWASRSGDGTQGNADFLIVFDVQGNSLDVGTRLFDANISQGGTTGGWTPLTFITDPTIADAEIDLGDPNDSGDDGLRGEGAINLSQTVFPSEPDSCLSIATIIPYTVTGNSDQADFKDVVLADFPSEITISSCGTVRITKTTEPAGGTGSFPYTLAQDDGGVVDFDGNMSRSGTLTADGDSALEVDLLADSDYTLVEGAVGPAWVLDSIFCDGQDITTGGTFAVVAGETTDCTITNRANEGTLTLTKVVDNLGESGPLGPDDFGLTIDGTPTNSGDAVTVDAGDRTIAEVAQGDYSVGAWSCDDGTTGAAGGTSLVVNVGGGEVVECTITNTLIAQPALTLVKTASPTTYDAPGDVISYTYDVTNTGNVSLAGPVTVADDKATVTCPDLTTVGNLDTDLDLGETITCTASYTITQADLNAGSVTNTATASADGTDSNPDDETVTADQNPALSLVKTASPSTYDSVGDVISYSYDVTNSGNVSLAGPVTVADDKATVTCPAVSTVGNGDGNLDPGESITCTTSYTITQADLNAGSVTNTATASADGTDSNPDDETVTADQNPALSLVKSASPSTYDTVGQSISYSYDVSNSGNVSLAGPVTVTDDKAAVSCPDVTTVGNGDGNLDPAESITCTASYSITQADLDNGSVTNTATASADGTDSNQDDETVTANQTPAILADKVLQSNADEDVSTDVSLGDTLTYRITATNDGNVTLTNVTVDDDLTGTANAPCAASLAPGASCFVDVLYVVTQADVDAGQIDNIGTVEGTPPVGDPVTDDDPETVGVPQNPALAVDKALTGNADEDGSGTVSLDDTLTYTVTATNTGNVTLTNVVVSDNLTTPGITVCSSVAPGDTCVLVGTHQVTQADVDNGEILNLGVANSDETPPVDDPEDVPVPQNPSIDLIKTGSFNDESGDGLADVGETISYSFTVINDGDVTLTNVTVTDLNVAVTVDGGPITKLDVGQTDSTTFTGSYTITQDDVDTGFFVNTARTTGTDPNGDPTTDFDTHNEPLPQGPSIAADKAFDANADEDGDGAVSAGDTLTYEITATNDGNVTLTNVTVDDDLTGTADAPCAASLAPGASCSVFVDYVVKQADVDAGVIENTGTVEGAPPSGGPVTDSDDESVPVPQNPALSVDKELVTNIDEDVSGSVSLGDTLVYSVVAINTGDVTLTNVVVSDDLTGDGFTCGSVAPGGACVLNVAYVVTQADVDAGVINNIGTADSDQTPPVEDPEIVRVPQNPAIQIVKSSSIDLGGDGIATPGDLISYTFEVTNTGDVTLTDVTVDDAQAGVVDCLIGTMAPGAVDDSTCSGSYAITQADIDSGSVYNQAFVAGEAPDGDPGNPEDDVTDDDDNIQPIEQGPALAVDKELADNADEDGSGDVSAGDTLQYTIAATNTGNVTLNNVLVSDDLTGDSTNCASVAPGGTCVLVTSYVVDVADVAAGKIVNTGTADSDETPPANDPNTEPVPQPGLAVDKVLTGNDDADGSGTVSLGDTLSYTITATNTGTANLTNVSVDDSLTGDSAACAIVLPNGTCTLDVTYMVQQSDVDAGQVVNVGTADSDQTPPTDDPNTEPVPQNPAIVADKVLQSNADEDASNTVSLDDTLTYRITATNNGNVTLTSVTVDDDLTGTTDAPCAASLAPGASCFVDVIYVVTQDDVDAGQIDNLGAVEGTPPIGDPVTDDDPETVDVPQNPAIQIVKTSTLDLGGDGIATPGDVISYAFEVTNTGNVTLANVTVNDAQAGVVDCVIGTMAPGAVDSTTCSGTYAITQADINAGQVDNQAFVAGEAPQGDPGDTGDDITDDDTDTEDIPQNPELSIDKTVVSVMNPDASDGGASVDQAGDKITYSIVVENTGNVTLTGVAISDPLLADLLCPPSDILNPGDSFTCSGTYTATQADIDGNGGGDGDIDNTATADSDQTAQVDDSEAVPVVQDPDITADKILLGNADEDLSGDVSLGDTLTYRITALNTGNVTLTNVTVDDDLTGTVDALCAPTLPVGLSCDVGVTYVVTQADVDAGRIENTGTVEGTDPNGDPVTDSDPEEVDVPQFPAISLAKDFAGAEQETVTAGTGSSFVLVVTNTGNVTLSDALVEDVVDGRLEVTSVSATGGADSDTDGNAQTVEWLIPTLLVGDSVTITVNFAVDSSVQPATIDNVAAVAAEGPLGDPGDPADDATDTGQDDIDVVTSADLSIAKDDGVTEVTAGDGVTYTYTISVANAGPSDADNVTFADVWPAGFSQGTVTPSQGTCDNAGGSFGCDLATIAAGGSATITVEYTVPSSTQAGDYTNSVSVTSSDPDPDPSNNSDNDTNEVLTSADLSIGKDDGVTVITAGDGVTYTYTISVANAGPSDADDVTVSDTWPAGFTQGTVTPSQGTCDNAGGSFGCDLATIAAGGSATITVEYTVPSSTQAGDYTNSVSVTSSDPDPDPSNNSDDDTNEVLTSADLSITKDDGVTQVTAGDGVTYVYTISVANAGPSDADDVTVSDVWPAGFSQGTVLPSQGSCDNSGGDFGCDLGTIAAGGSATITVAYTVPSSTQGGTYTNSVTVTSSDPDPDPSNNSDDDTNTVLTESDLSITKDDGVTQVIAGDGVTYTYTITVANAGPSDADNVTVTEDSFPAGFDMGTVASSQGGCAAFPCNLGTITAGGSATITVDYTVPSDTAAGFETNTVSVTSDEPDPNPGNDTDSDTNEVLTDITLSIVKTFDPTEVPQGTLQSFTIEVSNAGPSDALNANGTQVSVTDVVNTSLEVQAVTVTSGSGTCAAPSQNIDCTVDVPAGGSATITVDYLVAPFLDDERMYPSDVGGDEFRFVFVNGAILEGSTSTGEIYLDGIDISGDTTFVTSVTRNDIIVDLDGQGPDPAFEMHLSCSDPFTGGWGQSAGPVEGVDVNWQIAFFSIARYNNNGFIKNCGNVVNDFDVPNTATASGTDSFGTETVSDDATVTVGPGIILDKLTTKGKRLTVRLTNFTGADKQLVDVSAFWPAGNGDLTKTWLTQDGVSSVFWSGSDDPTDAFLDGNDPGWVGATLLQGEGIMRFDFANKVADSGYTIRVNFADGTFLDISR